jgi:hypothetical protein
MGYDIAIVETGNGGDLQVMGNDLAAVRGIENMPYLGMFGGNKEQVTKNRVEEVQSFDWWANSLLMPSNQSIQLNSITEKTFDTVPLTSSGRVLIENAIKEDLKFLSDLGATVVVSVTIVATDRIDILLRITQSVGEEKVTIINFKKAASGDWYILDFNSDDFFT